MTHLDEGTLVAIRDGALLPAEARLHLEECPPCETALAAATERAGTIEELLEPLADQLGSPDYESARAAVRKRLDARRAAPVRGRHLGRAAAILLLGATAVSALPGSPVRDWIESGQTEGAETVTATVESATEAIEVPVGVEGLQIVLRGTGVGVDISWTDALTARIEAAQGSRFVVAGGRAEVDVTEGVVTLTLPRALGPLSVEVGGWTVMTNDAQGIQVDERARPRGDGWTVPWVDGPNP